MSKNKFFLFSALGTCAVLATIYFSKSSPNLQQNDHLPIIAITQIATHPALDEVRQGIIEGLAEDGYIDGKNIKILFKNANGDGSLTVPIAQDFIRLRPDVIVPISTPSALAIASSTKDIPIVFSGVTDPVGVGLVSDLNDPANNGNITGVTDEFPYEDQVKTFQKLFPDIKTIGMIYTKGDDVSRVGVEAMKKLSQQYKFTLKLSPVSSGADIYPVATSMLQNVDAIYTGIDHLILENMDGLLKASREANKPLLGGESGSVEKGAVVSVSINMREFGRETSDMIEKILEGAKPNTLPIRIINTGSLVVNEDAAQKFNIDLKKLKQEGAVIYNEDKIK